MPVNSNPFNIEVVASGSETNLEIRTRELTPSNTPEAGVNFFRSEEGSPQIPNNRTSNQTRYITWQVEGIYYDPIRRRMHQLDRDHSSLRLEHAYLDEVSNTWVQVDTSLMNNQPPGHWRACDFDPATGKIYWQREATDYIYIYDPDAGWALSPPATGLSLANSDPGNLGFHPNLFGPNRPGCLTGHKQVAPSEFVAFDTVNQTWHSLNQSGPAPSDIRLVLFRGWSTYLPGRDELIMTDSDGGVVAFAAGAGLETDLSTLNSAELRNSVPGTPIQPYSTSNKCYACTHPRQPDVILAFEAANSAVYFTDDGAATAWKTASFTHPFASELEASGKLTVGTLPYHGVVVGADGIQENNTRFVFWRPPMV